MPKLGLTMREGTITNWFVAVGDHVGAGDPICEVETEKVCVEVESPEAGTVLRLLDAGITVPVGEGIAIIGEREDDVSGISLFGTDDSYGGLEERASVRRAERVSHPLPTQPLASPAARRLAEKLGVDLASVGGTGPGGRITTADVVAAAVTTTVSTIAFEEPSPMRRAIASAMTASAAIPQFVLERDVRVSVLESRLADVTARVEELAKPTVADALLLALARALRRHAELRRSWVDGRYQRHDEASLGIAVAVPEGLVVPVLRRVDELTIDQIAKGRRDLQRRAAAGTLSPSEVSGALFTVSNLGPMGVDRFVPLLNPPEAGIVGVGRTRDIAGERTLTLTLVGDHRVMNGAEGALLLAEIASFLEGGEGVE